MDQARFSVSRYLDGSSIYNRQSIALDKAVELFAVCIEAQISKQVVLLKDGGTYVQWTAEEGIRRL